MFATSYPGSIKQCWHRHRWEVKVPENGEQTQKEDRIAEEEISIMEGDDFIAEEDDFIAKEDDLIIVEEED
jgi:hypothetical protein